MAFKSSLVSICLQHMNTKPLETKSKEMTQVTFNVKIARVFATQGEAAGSSGLLLSYVTVLDLNIKVNHSTAEVISKDRLQDTRNAKDVKKKKKPLIQTAKCIHASNI